MPVEEHPRPGRPRVVILGGGFAGAYCAQKLDRLYDPDQVEVVLLDRNNYFVFYPLLVEAGTGALQPEHTLVSLRNFVPTSTFMQANVTHVSTNESRIDYAIVGDDTPKRMYYDHLVVAIGTTTLAPPVPGLEEHAYTMGSLTDALVLRDRAVRLLEQADAIRDPERRRMLLHWVIVGGGFTGIEVAGEFEHYLKAATRRYPNLSPEDVKVTIVNRGDRLLKMLDAELGRWTEDHLRARGLDVRMEEEVAEIGEEHVALKNCGERLAASTTVWCAGIQAHKVVKEWDLPTNKGGYLLCERDLRVKGFTNVWGLGDGAVNPDAQGSTYPTTAQAALGMGTDCAKNIRRVLAGEETEPCDLFDKGMLASFGVGDAVAQAFGIKFTGWLAWLMWRGVYLSKIPGLGRKVRVFVDWNMDLLTSRDYCELGFHKLHAVNRAKTADPGEPVNRDHVPDYDKPPADDEQAAREAGPAQPVKHEPQPA